MATRRRLGALLAGSLLAATLGVGSVAATSPGTFHFYACNTGPDFTATKTETGSAFMVSGASAFGSACVVAAATILASAVVVVLSGDDVSAGLVISASLGAGCVVPLAAMLATGGGGNCALDCSTGAGVCSWTLVAS